MNLCNQSKQPSVVILLKTKLGYMHLERGETSVFTWKTNSSFIKLIQMVLYWCYIGNIFVAFFDWQ